MFKRALTLDPNFAEAHDNLAWVYVNLGDQRSAAQSAEKAFALRDRVTELEKFYVTDTYHHWATVFPSQRPREKPFHIVTPSPGRGRASIAITRNYRIIDRNFEVFEWDCWFDQDSDKYKDAIPK